MDNIQGSSFVGNNIKHAGAEALKGIKSVPGKISSLFTNHKQSIKDSAAANPMSTLVQGGIHVAIGGGLMLLGGGIAGVGIGGGAAALLAGPVGPAIGATLIAAGVILGPALAGAGLALVGEGAYTIKAARASAKQLKEVTKELKKVEKESFNKELIEFQKFMKKAVDVASNSTGNKQVLGKIASRQIENQEQLEKAKTDLLTVVSTISTDRKTKGPAAQNLLNQLNDWILSGVSNVNEKYRDQPIPVVMQKPARPAPLEVSKSAPKEVQNLLPRESSWKMDNILQDEELGKTDFAQSLEMNKMRNIAAGHGSFFSRISTNTAKQWVRISDAFRNQDWNLAIDLLHKQEGNPEIPKKLSNMQTGAEQEWQAVSSSCNCGSRTQVIPASVIRVIDSEMAKPEDVQLLTFQSYLSIAYFNRAIKNHSDGATDQAVLLDLARTRIYSRNHSRGVHKMVWDKVSEFERDVFGSVKTYS